MCEDFFNGWDFGLLQLKFFDEIFDGAFGKGVSCDI